MKQYLNKSYSIEGLKTLVPSAFATHPKPSGLSSKYTFVPTDLIIERIMDYGFVPVFAKQSRALEANNGFQKHMIRFAATQDLDLRQEERFEIVMFNSHNGTLTYRFYGGFFRFICENGLVISSGKEADYVKTKHLGISPDDVVEASYRIIENAPKYIEWAEELKTIELTITEKEALAESAYELLEPSKKKQIDTVQLLDVRRHEDLKSDLWTTYNVVQENIMSGGLVRRDIKPRRKRSIRTRAVNSIDGQVRLNVALSKLVDKIREIRS